MTGLPGRLGCRCHSLKRARQNGERPSATIVADLKESVARVIRKERSKLNSVILGGVELDLTLGTLRQVTDKFWFADALKDHREKVQCLDMFQPFVIGRQFDEHDRMVMLTFATPHDLLNIFRAIGSGFSLMLQADTTCKASSAAYNKMGFAVNRLGGHCEIWSYTLIPAEKESRAAYTQAYRVTNKATRALAKLPLCDDDDCAACKMLSVVLSNPVVKSTIEGRPYLEKQEMPVDKALCDNDGGFQGYAREELGLEAGVCNTHVTAVGANNGSQKKQFTKEEIYTEWYDKVNKIKDIAFEASGHALQLKVVEWLQRCGEDRAADWMRDYWCGARGRWLIGNGGIGCIGNNQGLESRWRWDRQAICGGRQVHVLQLGNKRG